MLLLHRTTYAPRSMLLQKLVKRVMTYLVPGKLGMYRLSSAVSKHEELPGSFRSSPCSVLINSRTAARVSVSSVGAHSGSDVKAARLHAATL